MFSKKIITVDHGQKIEFPLGEPIPIDQSDPPIALFASSSTEKSLFQPVKPPRKLLNQEAFNVACSNGLFPHDPELVDIYVLKGRSGKTYIVKIFDKPDDLIKDYPDYKHWLISRLHKITDQAMDKGIDGVSFGYNKVATFIPSNRGQIAEIFDTDGNEVGFCSVSENYSKIILADINRDDIDFALVDRKSLETLEKQGFPYRVDIIEASMIKKKYQKEGLSTQIITRMMMKNLIAQKAIPVNERFNLFLYIDKSGKQKIAYHNDLIPVFTVAATLRSMFAMKAFQQKDGNMFPAFFMRDEKGKVVFNPDPLGGINWLEAAMRKVVAREFILKGDQQLLHQFIIKKRYDQPGLTYRLDDQGNLIIPESERTGIAQHVYDWLTQEMAYDPKHDAGIISGYASINRAKAVMRDMGLKRLKHTLSRATYKGLESIMRKLGQ